MSASAANLSVWIGDHMAVIRIQGRANFTSSVDFKAVVNRLWERGYSRFILDLEDCLLMDSTFLGVLAGLGLKFSRNENCPRPPCIELLNPNSRVSDLLENLGIAHLFKTCAQAGPPTDCFDPVDQPDSQDAKELSRTCLEAHQTLMDVNPANIPKFKDVAQFLAEDLKKKEGNS